MTERYRLAGPVIFWWVWVAFVALNVIDDAVQGISDARFGAIVSAILLLVTGLVIWRQYFSAWFGIEVIRLSALLHAFAAFVLISSIIVHIYAGIWVKGSMGAMLYGWVSRAWAPRSSR